MEFTYAGLVRYSFGFQNPNHAAALIVLLLPWTWTGLLAFHNCILRCLSGIGTIALITALTLTYSRAGMIVLIVVRTLINSFLTPLVEFGMGWAIIWLTILFFSLTAALQGQRQSIWIRSAAVSLFGLTISGLFSTCIDLTALTRPDEVGWNASQRGMTGLLCILSLIIVIFLCLQGLRLPRPKTRLLQTVATVLITVVILYAAGCCLDSGNSPAIMQIENDQIAICQPSKKATINAVTQNGLFLYDSSFSLSGAVHWLRNWYPAAKVWLPLTPWQMRQAPSKNIDKIEKLDLVILQGDCAYFARNFPGLEITLISPPEGIESTSNIRQLFLRRYREKIPWANGADQRLDIVYY